MSTPLGRPHVLLLGARSLEPLPALREAGLMVKVIDSFDQVDPTEWDVVITDSSLTTAANRTTSVSTSGPSTRPRWGPAVPDHLCVILLAPVENKRFVRGPRLDADPLSNRGQASRDLRRPTFGVIASSGVPGHTLRLPEALDPELKDRVESSLMPSVRRREFHTHFGLEASSDADGNPPWEIEPFLLGPRGVVLAGRYTRSTGASVWLLPEDVTDVADWAFLAFKVWRRVHGQVAFPGAADWTEEPEYRSARERSLHARRQAADGDLRAAQQRHREALAEIDAQLTPAADEANRQDRALLTSTGDELVAAVAWGLEVLGFEVVDMDKENPVGNRREDLHVGDPTDPAWIAITEVKGVTKGAPEVGLYQLAKRQGAYASSAGRNPPRLWYVINHHRAQDPATRRRPFEGHDDTIEPFAADGGLVLDTRALHALTRMILEGDVNAQQARNYLKTQTGVVFEVNEARVRTDSSRPTRD